jgi:hypothetical protein
VLEGSQDKGVSAVASQHRTAPDILGVDTVEDLIETLTRFFREMLESQGGDLSEVEDDVA